MAAKAHMQLVKLQELNFEDMSPTTNLSTGQQGCVTSFLQVNFLWFLEPFFSRITGISSSAKTLKIKKK